jgi:hypothetical protein
LFGFFSYLRPIGPRTAMRTKLRAHKHHSETGWARHRRQARATVFAPGAVAAGSRTAHRTIKSFYVHRFLAGIKASYSPDSKKHSESSKRKTFDRRIHIKAPIKIICYILRSKLYFTGRQLGRIMGGN